jgi:uncharacterized membrane protein YtjA (UPF0391 family)
MGPSYRREDKQPARGVEGTLASPVGTTWLGQTFIPQQRPFGNTDMLKWALFFFIISIIAAIFGFTGIAAAAAGIAKILFFIFLVICVIFLALGIMAGRAIL